MGLDGDWMETIIVIFFELDFHMVIFLGFYGDE